VLCRMFHAESRAYRPKSDTVTVKPERQFDLTLSLTQTEQGLIGSLVYNTDLFEAATIARMAGHFQTLLEDCS